MIIFKYSLQGGALKGGDMLNSNCAALGGYEYHGVWEESVTLHKEVKNLKGTLGPFCAKKIL